MTMHTLNNYISFLTNDSDVILRSLLPISIYGGHKDGVTGIRDIDLLHIETWRSGTFGRAMTNKGTTITNNPHCVHTHTAPLEMEGNDLHV